MTEREYRQDDQTAVGYCPKCGKQLANLTVGLRGYCEQHGWTFAEFTPVVTIRVVDTETGEEITDAYVSGPAVSLEWKP